MIIIIIIIFIFNVVVVIIIMIIIITTIIINYLLSVSQTHSAGNAQHADTASALVEHS